MVLTHDKIKKIEELVFERPRSVSELSHCLEVSRKTCNRYLENITDLSPKLKTHFFKSGIRGGLKVIYWKNIFTSPVSKQQGLIQGQILSAKTKEEFSPFDIYQYAATEQRKAFWDDKTSSSIYEYGTENINKFLTSAKYEYLSFSGDFSWTLQKDKGPLLALKTLEKMALKGVSIKIIGRVEFNNIDNVEQLLSINKKIGKEAISIRHVNQPLRGAIIDDDFVRLTETFKFSENKKRFVFYEIKDSEWVKFLKSIFWDIYNKGIPAEKRLKDLRTFSKRK
ncbi:hypothetical protein KO465_00860 [Candidatus Micrarchaeota archaeon]|jgi:hypothetical protein|nr:hypothetical protein [Candidatus Micrarchaeota archaeon]